MLLQIIIAALIIGFIIALFENKEEMGHIDAWESANPDWEDY